MANLDEIYPNLSTILYKMLQEYNEPVSEYELIRSLVDISGTEIEEENIFRNPALLFHTHFIMFHTLYKLQNDLVSDCKYYLSIDPLKIQLLPYNQSGKQEMASHDPLREYYLNRKNLDETTEDDVNELLNSFWRKLLFSDRRKEALDILELEDPVSQEEITLQYRRLVMKNHPDRGGENEKLQQLNLAIEILTKA